MLAKRPHHQNGSGGFITGTFLTEVVTLSTFRPKAVSRCVGVFERPGFFSNAEGLLIQDFLAAGSGEGPVYADRQLMVTETDVPAGLRFAGEIDVSNSSAVAQSLKIAFPHDGDPHLDVSRLSFCDVSGIRAIVEAALDLGEGRRLLLHGLPEQLAIVMRVTGWSALPNLALCACGGGGQL